MYDKKFIIKLVTDKRKISFRDLARILKVSRDDNGKFSKFLFTMVDNGEIFIDSNRDYYIPKILHTFEDEIRMNARGFGFVDHKNIDGTETNVFVPAPATKGAMDGDKVRVNVFADKMRPDSFQGIVSEILIRSKKTFVGVVCKTPTGFWDIKPFDARINGRFRFEDTSKLQEDYEVKVEITNFDVKFNTIKVIKVLGHKDDVSVDILAAIEDSGIPYDFNPLTIAEARTVPSEVKSEELKNRVDLRQRMIVTVDGDDTKDFDDAIEVTKLPNGNYMLGVHIADVTHYVKEGQPLDDEALTRGTSVYLADRVVPMLPEALSNGICSLNPNVDRLVLSCETEIDKNGKTVNYRVYEGVINSKYRLTYQQVNAYYRKEHSWGDATLEKMLDDALELSKIIRKFKEQEGYIDFEIEESKLIIDETGKTIDIVPRERLESEMLIEDFMVRANETVAYHAAKDSLPFIYRVHDKPDLDRVSNLQNVVKLLGIEVRIPQSPVPREFAKAINQIKETRFDDFMKVMMLRTMAKAEYSPKNIGHFGLASKYYTHFTSPIRRYPDLMVHRMLRTYFVENNLNAKTHFAEILPNIAEHASATEVRAVELERRVADIKKAEFYEKFVGQSFEGTIVSVMGFGFFVEFPNKVDGLVHVSTLIDGEYILGNNGYSLVGKVRAFNLGDKVTATVVGTHKDEGKIDLVIADLYEDWKKIKDNHQFDKKLKK